MHRIPPVAQPAYTAATSGPRGRPEKQFKIGERLSMNDLPLVTKDLQEEAAHWDLLAIYLDVDQTTYEEFEESGQLDSPSEKLQQGLNKWLEKETNPTWGIIVNALRSQDENKLAGEIVDKYPDTQTTPLTSKDLSTLEKELAPMAAQWYVFCSYA